MALSGDGERAAHEVGLLGFDWQRFSALLAKIGMWFLLNTRSKPEFLGEPIEFFFDSVKMTSAMLRDAG